MTILARARPITSRSVRSISAMPASLLSSSWVFMAFIWSSRWPRILRQRGVSLLLMRATASLPAPPTAVSTTLSMRLRRSAARAATSCSTLATGASAGTRARAF